MLQYLTPTTLEEMYKDLDQARLDILSNADGETSAGEYQKLTTWVIEIDKQYEALTGDYLWPKVACENS